MLVKYAMYAGMSLATGHEVKGFKRFINQNGFGGDIFLLKRFQSMVYSLHKLYIQSFSPEIKKV